MQQRLMRSRSEVVISGVCGGLGTYFGVDPVIVRLIFALVTLTTGLGLIIYPALWIAMPKAPALPERRLFDSTEPFVMQRERERVVAARYSDAPPPPAAYNFDPLTGAPIRPGVSRGETIQLPSDQSVTDLQYQPVAPMAPRSRRAGRWLAFGLIAFGGLILADQFHLNMEVVFPLVMIVIGIVLLRKR